MSLLKYTILSSLSFAFILAITSCEKEADKKKGTDYVKTGIVMNFAQETPAAVQTPSPALGSMDVTYSKATKILSWKVSWSGLLDSVLLMHIHGLAPVGFATGVVQNIITPSGAIFPQKTNNKFTFSQSGSVSGTMLVDGIKVKEEDLLNGLYYMNIHTNPNPGGEIRGQIVFQ